MMKRFESDYLEGAHPDVLRALIETNGEQTPGYGEDPHCEAARALLRERCALPEGEVQFLVGGTQVNRTVIASILRPHQGVVAADTGHIAAHETGAIENSGHKVLTVPNTDGKIAAAQVEELCRAHYADASFEHTVQPGMVYISNPTEFGTVYTRGELEALHAVCKARHLPLFIDGARLGYALASPANDVSMKDLARLADVFYAGGTEYDYDINARTGEVVNFSREGGISGGTTGSSGSYIGEAAATAAALTHAGVSEADTIYLRCWVEHDDGRAECYEVEFLAGTTEYQYEIDLYTGAVLKSERESHSVPASGSSGPHIGEAAAKSAALTHAGVSESDASRIQVELDRDDGRTLYEVEFHVGRTEYSYEIDASSGAIVKAEQELDD